MFTVACNKNEIVYFKSSVQMMSVFRRECVMDACVRNEKRNKRKYYMTEEHQHAVPCVGFGFHFFIALNFWFCHFIPFLVFALVFPSFFSTILHCMCVCVCVPVCLYARSISVWKHDFSFHQASIKDDGWNVSHIKNKIIHNAPLLHPNEPTDKPLGNIACHKIANRYLV